MVEILAVFGGLLETAAEVVIDSAGAYITEKAVEAVSSLARAANINTSSDIGGAEAVKIINDSQRYYDNAMKSVAKTAEEQGISPADVDLTDENAPPAQKKFAQFAQTYEELGPSKIVPELSPNFDHPTFKNQDVYIKDDEVVIESHENAKDFYPAIWLSGTGNNIQMSHCLTKPAASQSTTSVLKMPGCSQAGYVCTENTTGSRSIFTFDAYQDTIITIVGKNHTEVVTNHYDAWYAPLVDNAATFTLTVYRNGVSSSVTSVVSAQGNFGFSRIQLLDGDRGVLAVNPVNAPGTFSSWKILTFAEKVDGSVPVMEALERGNIKLYAALERVRIELADAFAVYLQGRLGLLPIYLPPSNLPTVADLFGATNMSGLSVEAKNALSDPQAREDALNWIRDRTKHY